MLMLIRTASLLCLFVLSLTAAAQDSIPKNQYPRQAGMFSLGVRSTISTFSHGALDEIGYGAGGHFRIQLTERISTEWYMDVLSTDIRQKANRMDYHIGWSVYFYILHPKGFTRKVTPYALAGHCFDYTRIATNGRNNTAMDRWSSAVQMGLGTHFNLTPRFDISVTCQYMLHLGNDLHAHVHDDGDVHIEEHSNAGWEGHLLISISANYKIARLWKSKKHS